MYSCFKLAVQKADFFGEHPESVKYWKIYGETQKLVLQDEVNKLLADATNADDIIDGERLTDTWFPVQKTDVFLSYSHDDEELAMILTGLLKKIFNLNVFMDELVWGSADDLLRTIDDEYCWQENGTYNYQKRNFSTSHVHAMLTTSIMKAMDQAEVVFFLNTENSTYKLNDGFSKKHTLSPWIYEEVMLANVLRKRNWTEYRQMRLDEMTHFEKSLNVAYPLELDMFKTVSFDDLVTWSNNWEKRKNNHQEPYGGLFLDDYEKIKHPLNVLYEMKFGKTKK